MVGASQSTAHLLHSTARLPLNLPRTHLLTTPKIYTATTSEFERTSPLISSSQRPPRQKEPVSPTQEERELRHGKVSEWQSLDVKS